MFRMARLHVAPARLAEKHESNVAELRKEWKHARQALKETQYDSITGKHVNNKKYFLCMYQLARYGRIVMYRSIVKDIVLYIMAW